MMVGAARAGLAVALFWALEQRKGMMVVVEIGGLAVGLVWAPGSPLEWLGPP